MLATNPHPVSTQGQRPRAETRAGLAGHTGCAGACRARVSDGTRLEQARSVFAVRRVVGVPVPLLLLVIVLVVRWTNGIPCPRCRRR
jgi:hypothetical protein